MWEYRGIERSLQFQATKSALCVVGSIFGVCKLAKPRIGVFRRDGTQRSDSRDPTAMLGKILYTI